MPSITNLKLLRTKQLQLGYTNKLVAELLSIPVCNYNSVRKGKRGLEVPRIHMLSFILGTTYEKLTGVTTNYPNFVLNVELVKELVERDYDSCRAFDKKVGKSRDWIGAYIRYEENASDYTIHLIAKGLNINPIKLLIKC